MNKSILAGALVLLLAACGGDDDAPAPNPPPSEASATIGAAGGTLDGPDGARVVIPPGALAQDTLVTIARRDTGAPALGPDGYTRRGATYEFTPHEIEFAQPVTMRIPVPAGAAAADEGVFRASPGGDWQAIGLQASGGFAEWQSASFSWYSGFACAISGGTADPFPCVVPTGFTQITPTPADALTLTSFSAQAANRFFRVRQAATLQLVASYSAAADCGDARIKLKRRRPADTQAVILAETAAIVAQSGSSRISARASFTVQLTDADNGSTLLITQFTCRRGYQPPARASLPPAQQYTGAFDVMVFDAQIPAPPQLVAPTVTQQPASQSVTAPATATFSAAASGVPAPIVQWEQSTDNGASWSPIAGATSPSFTTPATSTADNGKQFRAVFTNVVRGVPSDAATLTVAAPPAQQARIAAAFRHTCGVQSNGSVACWGLNSSGQIGAGNLSSQTSPFAWTLPETVTSVAAGPSASCALTASGSVFCASIGFAARSSTPTQKAGISGARQIVLGSSHACALAADGTVWCWGSNANGQLGDGSDSSAVTPVQVRSAASGLPLDNVTSIAAGSDHTCAIVGSGGVACWGANQAMQSGSADPGSVTQATRVAGLGGAVQLAAGDVHTCVLLDPGVVRCWGLNSDGQFGDGSTSSTPTATPTLVSGLEAIALASGARHVCAVSRGGSVLCWGTAPMGNGNPTEVSLTLTTVSGLNGVVALAAGFEHTCAQRADASLSCWGANGEGQLGLGDTVPRFTPTSVPGVTIAAP